MKKILSLLAVAAMAFTACTTDITEDVNVNTGAEYSVPLEFAVEQGETRAFMDDDVNIQFEEGDVIGVYVTPADASKEATKNAKFTISLKNGILTAGGQVASFAAGDTVMAYYPYTELNNNNEATAIKIALPHVQYQTGERTNLKHMPMVSVATTLDGASGGKILFRPAASIMKLMIHSADYSGSRIASVLVNIEKYSTTGGCNHVTGIRSGIDLTTITEDSEISMSATSASLGGDVPSGQKNAWQVWAFYTEGGEVAENSASATPIYLCVWPGNYGGKNATSTSLSYIKIYTEKGRFDFKDFRNPDETSGGQYEFARGMIRPFSLNLEKCENKVPVDLAYIHKYAHVTGNTEGSDAYLTEELIVIGSGAECDNIGDPKQTAWNVHDISATAKVAYAQTLDGSLGVRLNFADNAENTLKRGDKISMMLTNTTFVNPAKANGEKNPATSTIKQVSINNVFPTNFINVTSGCENEIVVKEKSIAELTDNDIHTEVTLTDMEFVVKDAPYVTGYDSPVMTNVLDDIAKGVPTKAVAVRAMFATMMQDANNDAIYVLINSQCEWKRDLTNGTVQVPQGVGPVHGVLVHSDYKAYGNLGKYQLRPYDETSFAEMGKTAADAVTKHAAWYLNKYTVSVGQYTWNGATSGGFKQGANDAITTLQQNKMHATVGLTDGSAVLYTTNLTAYKQHNNGQGTNKGSSNYANWQYHPDIRDGFKAFKQYATAFPNADNTADSKATSLCYRNDVASYYGWKEDGSWDGSTTGLVAEFPGAGKEMAISFSIGSMNPGKTNNENVINDLRDRAFTFGFPLYWKVECSVDGGNSWERCICALTGDNQFKMNPTMHYFAGDKNYYTDANKTITTEGKYTPVEQCPSFLQQKFILPESAIGAAKVMVKISPASLRLAGFPETYTDSIDTGVDCTKDYYYSHVLAIEDVAVTYAK